VSPRLCNGVRVSRSRAVLLAVVLAALAGTACLADSARATGRAEKNMAALNHQVLGAVNRFRVAHGLVALHESAALDRSALRHSSEMGRRGYFAHASADGTAFWRRIGRYYSAEGYSYWSVGENLAWQAPTLSAGSAMRFWIGSPPHLANLLSKQWRQIGISAVSVARAPGVYGGQRVVIVTTDFGVRS
jgi:uncharacterized protein YkwD